MMRILLICLSLIIGADFASADAAECREGGGQMVAGQCLWTESSREAAASEQLCKPASVEAVDACKVDQAKLKLCSGISGKNIIAMATNANKDTYTMASGIRETLATCKIEIDQVIKTCSKKISNCEQVCNNELNILNVAVPQNPVLITTALEGKKTCESQVKKLESVQKTSSAMAANIASIDTILPQLLSALNGKDKPPVETPPIKTEIPLTTANVPNIPGSLGGKGNGKNNSSKDPFPTPEYEGDPNASGSKSNSQLAQFQGSGGGGGPGSSSSGGGQGASSTYDLESDGGKSTFNTDIMSESGGSASGGGRRFGAMGSAGSSGAVASGSGYSSDFNKDQSRAKMVRGIASMSERSKKEVSEAMGMSNFQKINLRMQKIQHTLVP